MKKTIYTLLLSAIAVFILTGCTTKQNTEKEPEESGDRTTFHKISAKEAKEMMDELEDLVILDVRTEEEYNSGHIEGSILIPDFEIETNAEEILEDKSATILVYCRSGRRSALASQALSDLGYTTVYDFGGIIDWTYDIVTE